MRDDWSMSGDAYLFNNWHILAPDQNLLANNLRLFPLSQELVLTWIIRIELLHIQVLHIGDGVGNTPGNMLVMSNNHTGCAGKTDAGYIDLAADQMTFKPDRGDHLSKMRIIAEHRSATFGLCAIDHPVITASHRAQTRECTDLLILFQQAQIDPLIGDAWGHNERMVGIITGFKLSSALGSELANQAGADQFGLPVTGQAPTLDLAPLQYIGSGKGLWLNTQDGELHRETLAVLLNSRLDSINIRIHAIDVSVDDLAGLCVEVLGLFLRCSMHAQAAHKAISL